MSEELEASLSCELACRCETLTLIASLALLACSLVTFSPRSSGGLRAFYHGLSPALLRAFPVHAMIFFTYANVTDWLERHHM